MITKSKFSPRWWLRNPHLQTIVASKFAKSPPIESDAERIELKDGDFLDINWSKKNTGPWVCIFHGLAGSIDSAYAKAVFAQLETHGMRPVFMHWRGCSGEPNRLARSYHSGATEDIHFLITLVHQRFPTDPLYAIGYSLGANALLKYLGEQGQSSQLSGAVSVCPPLLLSVGADKLNTGVTRGYQRYLLAAMREHHEAKRECYPDLNLPEATKALDNFWKFDDTLTAPLHGFQDVHDYYTQCSARQYLSAITLPTHILYALDDPFFTTDVVPQDSELGASITLELSQYGGHVGFIGDTTERDWLAKHLCALLQQFHTQQA